MLNILQFLLFQNTVVVKKIMKLILVILRTLFTEIINIMSKLSVSQCEVVCDCQHVSQ